MPFVFQPYHVEPYRNPYTANLTALIGAPERAQAQAQERIGASKARAAENIAGNVTNTLASLAARQQRVNDPDYQLASMRVQQARSDQQDDVLMRRALANNGGDPEKALRELRASGEVGVTAAGKLQTQVSAALKDKMQQADDQLKRTTMQLDVTSRLLNSVPDPVAGEDGTVTPHPEAAQAYAAVVPKLREVLGPQLAGSIPDQYDPQTVNGLKTMSETAAEHTQRERLSLDKAKLAVESGEDRRKKDKYFTESLALTLSNAESQEEWDQKKAGVLKAGGDQTTLDKFPAEWSPENAKKALAYGLTPEQQTKAIAPEKKKDAEPGSLAAFTEAYARDVAKRPAGTLSLKEQTDVARRWAAAHREETGDGSAMTPAQTKQWVDAIIKFPSIWNDQNLTATVKSKLVPELVAGGFTQFGDATRGQIAQAERYKSSQLAELEKEYRASQLNPDTAMSADELTQRKAVIQKSYLVQLGAAGKPAPGGGADAGEQAPTVTPEPAAPKTPTVAIPKGLVPGAKVTLKGGKKVTVKAVNPDGTFTYE